VHPQYQNYRRCVPMLLPFTKVRPQEATQIAPGGQSLCARSDWPGDGQR
jgi:hypothetical protein